MNSKVILSNVSNYYITDAETEGLLYKAKEYGVEEVLLGPSSIPLVHDQAKKSGIKISASISYPSGAYLAEAKTSEISELMALYPDIEAYYVVLAEGAYLSKGVKFLENELNSLVIAVGDKKLFVVVEIATIIRHQKLSEFVSACRASRVTGILISTGFNPYKASWPSAEDVKKCRDMIQTSDMYLLGTKIGADEELCADCDKVVVMSRDMALLS